MGLRLLRLRPQSRRPLHCLCQRGHLQRQLQSQHAHRRMTRRFRALWVDLWFRQARVPTRWRFRMGLTGRCFLGRALTEVCDLRYAPPRAPTLLAPPPAAALMVWGYPTARHRAKTNDGQLILRWRWEAAARYRRQQTSPPPRSFLLRLQRTTLVRRLHSMTTSPPDTPCPRRPTLTMPISPPSRAWAPPPHAHLPRSLPEVRLSTVARESALILALHHTAAWSRHRVGHPAQGQAYRLVLTLVRIIYENPPRRVVSAADPRGGDRPVSFCLQGRPFDLSAPLTTERAQARLPPSAPSVTASLQARSSSCRPGHRAFRRPRLLRIVLTFPTESRVGRTLKQSLTSTE